MLPNQLPSVQRPPASSQFTLHPPSRSGFGHFPSLPAHLSARTNPQHSVFPPSLPRSLARSSHFLDPPRTLSLQLHPTRSSSTITLSGPTTTPSTFSFENPKGVDNCDKQLRRSSVPATGQKDTRSRRERKTHNLAQNVRITPTDTLRQAAPGGDFLSVRCRPARGQATGSRQSHQGPR